MSTRPLLPASSGRASDALEEAQFRARMARVGPDGAHRTPRRNRAPERRRGFRLGWKGWLVVDCLVVLLVVAGGGGVLGGADGPEQLPPSFPFQGHGRVIWGSWAPGHGGAGWWGRGAPRVFLLPPPRCSPPPQSFQATFSAASSPLILHPER